MNEREVWVRPTLLLHGSLDRWVLSDTLPREEAINLMGVFVERGFQVRLTTKGGTYVTDKSW